MIEAHYISDLDTSFVLFKSENYKNMHVFKKAQESQGLTPCFIDKSFDDIGEHYNCAFHHSDNQKEHLMKLLENEKLCKSCIDFLYQDHLISEARHEQILILMEVEEKNE